MLHRILPLKFSIARVRAEICRALRFSVVSFSVTSFSVTSSAAPPATELPSPTAADIADIADLFVTRCLSCHDSDGPAPIRFDNTTAILRHRALMRALVEDRSMPPASAESTLALIDSAHTGRGALSEDERKTLLNALQSEASVKAAFPEIASASATPKVASPSAGRVIARGTWSVPARGGMGIRSFYAPLDHQAPIRLRGWRMIPAENPARSPIRYVSLAADPARASRILDENGTGAEAMGDVGQVPSGSLGALSRTAPEFMLPAGFAFELPAGDLVIETTVEPIGREVAIQPAVEMLTAQSSDTRTVEALAARVVPLSVAAGERVDRVVHVEITRALDLVGVVAKGGVFLRGFAVDVVAADGCRTPIARDRDFRMNLTAPLVFRNPPELSKGSVIEVRFDLDNTPKNPLQPFDPPRPLAAGLPPEGEDAAIVLLVATRDTR